MLLPSLQSFGGGEDVTVLSSRISLICANDHEPLCCACGHSRCVREPRRRGAGPLQGCRACGGARPGGGDVRQRGVVPPLECDDRLPDVFVTVPFTAFLPEQLFFGRGIWRMKAGGEMTRGSIAMLPTPKIPAEPIQQSFRPAQKYACRPAKSNCGGGS